ncbi:lyase family protein [Arthrobacter sunyaminii]|uniref:lyase family protein n=1 Tax=Arthrobacter sunyaminii TaxID=2816859 RepID=UPI001A94261F|nr:lyase family protein [Arthrobacter sunyaminii]MBO0897241.1 adenylosuccinate lyase family protein [Arthrobacter sunyaminii]
MTGSVSAADTADYGLLSPVWAGTTGAGRTGDRRIVQKLLDIELQWLRVLAGAGIIAPQLPDEAAPAFRADLYDPASLAARSAGGGNPVIPLLADLRAKVRDISPAAAEAVHTAATSQDILDTALMLVSADTLAGIASDTRRTMSALAGLAVEHRHTLCVARTLTQHSLPSTFGLRAAQWLHGIGQAAEALETTASRLPLQWGGGSGTLAALRTVVDASGSAATPLELADELALRLGLAAPAAPWQGNRLPVTAVGAALQDLLSAAGKIANDVLLMSRPEVAEVSEPRAAGRGGSSAMPQKRNPVLSVLIRSAALAGPGCGAALQTAAGAADDERPGGSWHTEWQALRSLLRLASGAAEKLAELTEGLTVNTAVLRDNLLAAGPLVVSERLMATVAPLLDDDGGPGSGKARLQELVTAAQTTGSSLGEKLRKSISADVLSDAELAAQLDPANYVGEASALIDRILAAYPVRSSR